MSDRKGVGSWGESYAADYLTRKGYTILEKNVRTAHGEIDLVAQLDRILVIVEVKTRTTHSYGNPEESITPRKIAHLLSSAQEYLQNHPEFDGDWRIDVVAIQRIPGEESAQVLHFENAIQGA